MDLEVGKVYLCEVWKVPRELEGRCSGATSSLELLVYDGQQDWGESRRIQRCGDTEYELVSKGPISVFVPVPGSDLAPGPIAEVIPLRVMQPDRPQPEKQEVMV